MIKLLKSVIKQPIKDTLILMSIALAALIMFGLISRVLGQVTVQDLMLGKAENPVFSLLKTVIRDFAFMSKLAFEIAFVVLVAQVIYYFAKK